MRENREDVCFFLFVELYAITFMENILIITNIWLIYSDPTPDTSDVPIKWIPSSKERLNYLYIREKLEMGPMIHPDGYQLWKYIYNKYRKTHIY